MTAPPAATREQIRRLDRIAIEHYGIPGAILMENAGRACAEAAADMLGGAEGRRVLVVCGKGNNGGDGFVLARHLANRGARVEVLLLARIADVLEADGESALNLRIARRMETPVRELADAEEAQGAIGEMEGCDLVVDALLGTGVSGEVREPFRSAIEAINAQQAPVLAVDVPSGLDCDTGEPLGVAVRADRTVTFAVAKAGFTRSGAEAYTGPVEVAEIGIPRAEIETLLSPAEERQPRRSRRTTRKARRNEFDDLSHRVIGCALEVHRQLGPGLLEAAYGQCLAHELSEAGIPFAMEPTIPVMYKGVQIACGYRPDFLVDDSLILELKAVQEVLPVHEAQVLTYMRLAHVRTGLLVNFHVKLLKNGIKRFVL